VLPYGIRQLIKDYLGALDNDSIRTAVKLWCENREEAISRYGHISLWDTHRVTNMSRLFYNRCSFDDNISGWDVSKVTTLSQMFNQAKAFNQSIGTWNTSNVTDMSYVFIFADTFNQPLQDWDVSSVTNMDFMFGSASVFNQPLSKWNVSLVTTMLFMLSFSRSFNQPLNDWDVSRVQSLWGIFSEAIAFNQPLDRWNLATATNISQMFCNATAFNQPLVSWNVASIAQKQKVFDLATFSRRRWRRGGPRDTATDCRLRSPYDHYPPPPSEDSVWIRSLLVDYQVASVTRTTSIPRDGLSGGQDGRSNTTAHGCLHSRRTSPMPARILSDGSISTQVRTKYGSCCLPSKQPLRYQAL
jgi:surface protein